ncbi:hypothetical protein GWI34_41355, partial [Actinomadura sp. DSM 109109]|nr:hypothetical protein [Actinomadura lepetitiana]
RSAAPCRTVRTCSPWWGTVSCSGRAKMSGDDRRNVAGPAVSAEQAMLTVLRTLLDDFSIGANDDFFMVGGHSLLAMRFVGQLRREGLVIEVRDIFEKRTVRALAALARTQ